MQNPNIDAMSGVEFEKFVGSLLRSNGYLVDFTQVTGDFGVDLVAHNNAERIAIQCKRNIKPVGPAAVQQVVAGATMYDCTTTMVVSSGSFTLGAVLLAKRNNCILIGKDDLVRLAAVWLPDSDTFGVTVGEPPLRSADTRGRGELAATLERLTRHARDAVVHAEEVVHELNAVDIAPVHLLFGILQSAPELAALLAGHGLTADRVYERLADGHGLLFTDDDAAALRSIGIDLDEVRDRITKVFGAEAFRGRPDSGRGRRRPHMHRSTKKLLELALREAIAHKDNCITCEHMVLGMLRGRDDIAATLLTEHVEPRRLRSEVIALLEHAA